ncbi:MAG: helix-turn-helix domain-containing protein [Actinomycetota bacterium]
MKEQLDTLVAEMVARGIGLVDAQREFEAHFITRVLRHHRGNVSRAAAVLGMHRNTLTRKLRALRIRVRRPGPPAAPPA